MTKLCLHTATRVLAYALATALDTWRSRAAVALVVLGGWAAYACTVGIQPGFAWSKEPRWTITSVSRPTNFAPGDATGDDAYVVTITNTGGASTDGSPITVSDELPEGLEDGVVAPSGEDELAGVEHQRGAQLECAAATRTCAYNGRVTPGDTLIVTFPVGTTPDIATSCEDSTPCVTNTVRVAGGGAADASITTRTHISTGSAPFGLSPGGVAAALSTTQAGAHPDMTVLAAFNTVNSKGSLAGDPKDTEYELPAGFAGDLVDTPSCPAAVFQVERCSVSTQVGITTIDLTGGLNGPQLEPVYNLSPNSGEIAKLGFNIAGNFGIQGDVSLTNDYRLTTTFHNIDETDVEVDGVSLTLWGVPTEAVHDPLRWEPPTSGFGFGHFGTSSTSQPAAFFTNPTSCAGSLSARLGVDSWQGAVVENDVPLEPMTGCDRLAMAPMLTAQPSTDAAYAPTGMDVGLEIPQTYDNAQGLATSNLQNAVVSLPEGMTVNPSAGAGLGACTEEEYSEEAIPAVDGRGCPSDAKLGVVTAESPSIKEIATGAVYLASPAPRGEPGRNPFNALLALYMVMRVPDRGILIKAAGHVIADPTSGRLVAVFEKLPPLPFNLFTLRFSQGGTSPLVTPASCGQYAVAGEFSPSSAPAEPLPAIAPPFSIVTSFDGGACPTGNMPPFHPEVIAGTQNNRAGSYSAMYLRAIRGDGEQEVTRFSASLPLGLTANLTGVPFCSDAAIALAKTKTGAQEQAEPSCPQASQIGHTLVGAGVGSVLVYAPGKLYMAGPYHGAPFSVVAVTTARVGPFDLGTVVIREAIDIDPLTAAVTVDASASDPIPHIIDGIVVHVRDIRVYIDRPHFVLNPTNCLPMRFSATVTGSGRDVASTVDDVPVTIDDSFQAAECQSLGFSPTFGAATSGRPTRRTGIGLVVKLNYPHDAQGKMANIRAVKVDLPRQLPSRLTTLQKACPHTVFQINPASCPAASRVGAARASTPILPVPLIGPAYFVSFGGEKFPELVMVLQGYGVTVELRGETYISKTGTTSSTFRSVPDQPVEGFELTLPRGEDSALAANGDLCRSRPKMRIALTAQNGRSIHRAIALRVTGCASKKRASR